MNRHHALARCIALKTGTLLLVLSLAANCSGPPEPVPLTEDVLLGSWTATLEHNGQHSPLGMRFDRQADGAIAVFVALPAIEAWAIPVGQAEAQPPGEVHIGRWVLAWDPLAQTLTADVPESLVPIHKLRAVFKRSEPVGPTASEHDDVPVVEPVWTKDLGAAVWAGVAYDNGVVYAGSDSGELVALDAGDGRLRWRVSTGGPIRARATVHGERLYVPSDDGQLYCIRIQDGAIAWKVPIVKGEFERGARYDYYAASAVVVDKSLFIGTGDGQLLALDPANGKTRWQHQAPDAISASPAVVDGRVYFSCFDGKLRCLDAATGEQLWEYDSGAAIPSAPAVVDGRVIVGSRSYDLTALDAETGMPDWSFYYWFSWIDSSPSVADDTVYVGSSDALRLYAFDVSSGRMRWSFRTGGWSWPQPAVGDDTVYMGSIGTRNYIGERSGGFFAVDRASGAPRWRYPAPPLAEVDRWGFASSAAIGAERVFTGGLDGTLYAFPKTR